MVLNVYFRYIINFLFNKFQHLIIIQSDVEKWNLVMIHGNRQCSARLEWSEEPLIYDRETSFIIRANSHEVWKSDHLGMRKKLPPCFRQRYKHRTLLFNLVSILYSFLSLYLLCTYSVYCINILTQHSFSPAEIYRVE